MCYSSPNAVGPIAIIEYEVVEIIDDYVKNNMKELVINNDVINVIFEHVLKEINVDYLKFTIRTRLEELKEEYDEKHKPLLKMEFTREKSNERFYQFENATLYLDEIEEMTYDEQRLNELILNKLKELNNEKGYCMYAEYVNNDDESCFNLIYYWSLENDVIGYKFRIIYKDGCTYELLCINPNND